MTSNLFLNETIFPFTSFGYRAENIKPNNFRAKSNDNLYINYFTLITKVILIWEIMYIFLLIFSYTILDVISAFGGKGPLPVGEKGLTWSCLPYYAM